MHREHSGTTKYNINDLELEYLTTDDTIFSENEELDRWKHIIKDELTDTEKRLMLLYIHLASQRKVAQLLRVSPATINRLIREIQRKIKYKYNNNTDDDNNNTDDSGNTSSPIQHSGDDDGCILQEEGLAVPQTH